MAGTTGHALAHPQRAMAVMVQKVRQQRWLTERGLYGIITDGTQIYYSLLLLPMIDSTKNHSIHPELFNKLFLVMRMVVIDTNPRIRTVLTV